MCFGAGIEYENVKGAGTDLRGDGAPGIPGGGGGAPGIPGGGGGGGIPGIPGGGGGGGIPGIPGGGGGGGAGGGMNPGTPGGGGGGGAGGGMNPGTPGGGGGGGGIGIPNEGCGIADSEIIPEGGGHGGAGGGVICDDEISVDWITDESEEAWDSECCDDVVMAGEMLPESVLFIALFSFSSICPFWFAIVSVITLFDLFTRSTSCFSSERDDVFDCFPSLGIHSFDPTLSWAEVTLPLICFSLLRNSKAVLYNPLLLLSAGKGSFSPVDGEIIILPELFVFSKGSSTMSVCTHLEHVTTLLDSCFSKGFTTMDLISQPKCNLSTNTAFLTDVSIRPHWTSLE